MNSIMFTLPFFSHRKRLTRQLEASEQQSTREHAATMRALDIANQQAKRVLTVIEHNGISLTMARAMGHNDPDTSNETKKPTPKG